jgi:Ca-activated chloride channel homolog
MLHRTKMIDLRLDKSMSRLLIAALLWSGSLIGLAQQPAATPSPTQAPLTVDRDPVASPDPDPPPGAASATSTVGTIERERGKYTLRTDAYEVRLNASVLDGSGKSIQTLDKDAFRIYEDGVPQTIASFRHEDLPVSLGILIDRSGSMYDKRVAVEQASLDLIKLSNREDEAFVVDFSWEAFIDQDFTNDIGKLQQGLSFIKSSGGTAIYDALVASADYLTKNAKHPKQVLLIITDGEDNASSATLEQAIRRIQDLDGPVIYCVGLLFGADTDRTEARHARRVLEALSEQTGGAAYFPKSVKEVDAIAAEVAQDIRTQYTISYHSTKSPTLGGYRQIHVDAKDKGYGKLSVRTRSGYFPKVAAAAEKSGNGPAQTDSGKRN